MTTRLYRLSLAAPAAALTAFCWRRYRMFPPNADEAFHAVVGHGLTRGAAYPYYLSWSLPTWLGGAPLLPWMSGDYVGRPDAYLLYPIWRLAGFGLGGVRAGATFLGVAAGLLFAAATRRFFGRRVAATAAILIFLSAQYSLGSLTCLAAETGALWLWLSGVLYCASRWQEDGAPRWLAAAAFLCGLGLWQKIAFVFYIVAFSLGFLIFSRRRLSTAATARALLWLAVGSAPLLWFNATHNYATMRLLRESFSRPTVNGVDNRDIAANLERRLEQAQEVLEFRELTFGSTPRPDLEIPRPIWWSGYLLLAPLLALLWPRFRRDFFASAPARVFTFAAPCLFALLCFTVSWLGPYHFLWILPVWLIMIAAVLERLIKSDALLAAALAIVSPGQVVLAMLPNRDEPAWKAAAAEVAFARDLTTRAPNATLVLDPTEELRIFVLSGGLLKPQAASCSLLGPKIDRAEVRRLVNRGPLIAWDRADRPERLPEVYEYLSDPLKDELSRRRAKLDVLASYPVGWARESGLRLELIRWRPDNSENRHDRGAPRRRSADRRSF